MGTWGIELYQNDTALDVKEEFLKQFNAGKGAREITDELIADYSTILEAPDEAPPFWFALADTQWELSALLPDVKEKALFFIDKAAAVPHSQAMTQSESAKQKEILDSLEAKLLSPQPPRKKPVKRRTYRCQWKLGDVFAYRLESDTAKERGLYGRFFLIQKVDECVWYPGHIVPIVYVKITKDETLPVNAKEYNALEFVQTGFSKYEECFWPIDMRHPQEDIAEKSKIHYQTDAFGYLPRYRVTLLNTSPKVIPSKLFWVGNFADAAPPANEFIPHSKMNISSVSWVKFGETFESVMLKRYCGHNLRELGIYTGKTD